MHETAEKEPLVGIWGALIGLTFLSAGVTKFLGHGLTLTFAIFVIALLKASLVGAYFMHLRKEPLVIWVGVLSALAVVVMVYLGMIPDIVYQFGRIS